MCFGCLWMHSLCCTVSDASGNKDRREHGRTDRHCGQSHVGLREHGNFHQCDHSFISFIRVAGCRVGLSFTDNSVHYEPSMPHITWINSTSRSSLSHSAIIVDCKGYGHQAVWYISYALRLASCYNKSYVRAYIGDKCFWTRVHWPQKSGRFENRIGQTCVVLVWTTKDKSFIKS